MSDDVLAPEVEAPFDTQPADLGGCGKPAVIGCLVILVVLAIGFVIFLAKARDMLSWALTQYESAVITNLSEDVTTADQERLENAFESARDAVRDNEMDPVALQQLQRFMASPPSANQQLGPERVRELIEVLEAVAGEGSALPQEEPVQPSPATHTAMIRHATV